MAKKNRILIDNEGREYDSRMLDAEIVKRDEVVNKLIARAEKLNEKMSKEKEAITTALNEYLAELAQKYGKEWKGNTELLSFDGKSKVSVNVNENIDFGPELQLAKQLIDECLIEWTADGSANIKAIVLEAFNVDKKGKIDKRRILTLNKYSFEDARWAKAMELIQKSIVPVSSKKYINFYVTDEDGKFKPLSLNFSSL